jgi:molecular chaperone HscB
METATSNYFELFGLPPRFSIDLATLENAFRRLQGELHPDRHVSNTEMQRRIALQLSTTVNDAYRTLRHSTSRAQCLIDMSAQTEAKNSSATVPPAFLMAQMEWREAIESACAGQDVLELEALSRRLRIEMSTKEKDLADALDKRGDIQSAAMRVNELHFYERLRAEIDDALDHLDY